MPTADLRQKINEGRDAWDVIDARHREHNDGLRDINDSDHFTTFTRNITASNYTRELKLVGITKYDDKQDSR